MRTADELHNFFLIWVRERAETGLSADALVWCLESPMSVLLYLPLAVYEAARRPILFWGIGLQTKRKATFL